MIHRRFHDILGAWRGMTEELAYSNDVKPARWGVCLGYPELLHIEIEDALLDSGVHLGMASFTKSRWTRFLRRYFRSDLKNWVTEATKKLSKYPSRPFVASYSMNINVEDAEGRSGHNYGGCLSSLQIRICPEPRVILYSRACQIDKIGLLDLALIHIIAKELAAAIKEFRGLELEVTGTWVVSNAFISGISQIYYLHRFNKPIEGHRMKSTLKRLIEVDYDDIKFGPLKRGRKRMEAFTEHGEIPKSVPISKLTIEPSIF